MHNKISLVLNKHKIYDYEDRAFESFGNICSLKIISYKLYLKTNLKIPRYSYLVSSRCIDFFSQDSFTENLSFKEFTKYKNKIILLHLFSTCLL